MFGLRMYRGRAWFSGLLTTAVMFAGGWFYLTPYIAMSHLEVAALTGDGAALSELVDVPALRESVQQNVGAAAGPSVDGVVTAQGIAGLIEGRLPGDPGAAAAGFPEQARRLQTWGGYQGVDRFAIHYVDRLSGRERMALVLRRQGIIHWRLSAVRIPAATSDGS